MNNPGKHQRPFAYLSKKKRLIGQLYISVQKTREFKDSTKFLLFCSDFIF